MIEHSGAEVDAVKKIVQRYVAASGSGDVDALKSVFHPKALMAGFLQGQLGIGSPDPFFEAVSNNPPPEKSGEPYVADISNVEVAGQVACATLVEKNFLGMDFVDYFHLIKEENKWFIISKTFSQG